MMADRGSSDHIFSHEYIFERDTREHIFTHEYTNITNIMNNNSAPDTPLPGQTFSAITSPRQLSRRDSASTPSHNYRHIYQTVNPFRRSPERDAMLAAVASRTSTPSRQSRSISENQTLEQQPSETKSAEQVMLHHNRTSTRTRHAPSPLEARPGLIPPPSNVPSTPLSPHASPFYSTAQQHSAFHPPSSSSQGAFNPQSQSPQIQFTAPDQLSTNAQYMSHTFQQDTSNDPQHAHQNFRNTQRAKQTSDIPLAHSITQQSPLNPSSQPQSSPTKTSTLGPQYSTPYFPSPLPAQRLQQHQHPSAPPSTPSVTVTLPQAPLIPPHPAPHNPYSTPSQEPHSRVGTPVAQAPTLSWENRTASLPIAIHPPATIERRDAARALLNTLEKDRKMLGQCRKTTYADLRELEDLLGGLKARRDREIARRDWAGEGSARNSGAGVGAAVVEGQFQGQVQQVQQQGGGVNAGYGPQPQPQLQHQPQQHAQNQRTTMSIGQQIFQLQQEIARIATIHDHYGTMARNVGDNIEQMWSAVAGVEGEEWERGDRDRGVGGGECLGGGS